MRADCRTCWQSRTRRDGLYRAGDQFLVAAMPVGIRAVEKIDADFARMPDCIDRRISVGLVVERRHRRTAETDRKDLELTELAPLHAAASSTYRLDLTSCGPRPLPECVSPHVTLIVRRRHSVPLAHLPRVNQPGVLSGEDLLEMPQNVFSACVTTSLCPRPSRHGT